MVYLSKSFIKDGESMKKTTIIIIILIIIIIALAVAVGILLTNKNEEPADNNTNIPGQNNVSNSNNNSSIEKNPIAEPLANAIKTLPSSDSLTYIWQLIPGYWTTLDNKMYVVFKYENNESILTYGLWNSGFEMSSGKIIDSKSTGEYEMEISVLFPAVAASMVDDGRPETTVKISVDLTEYLDDGKIKVKIENQGNGDWYQYVYCGHTAEEAYENIF